MEKAFRQIVRAAELKAGSRLLLAVSGGVDSVVLLSLLTEFAAEFQLDLRVLHLDHKIRTESETDALFVSELCQRLKVPCRIESVDIPALASERRLSLETAGREVRREYLMRQAKEQGCIRIVLGHHLDDQAETFLQRLLRGTGVSGLQAMQPLDGLWWRPLLECSQQQILEYARKMHLDWVEDGSNQDLTYLRNRIRHQLLPALREYNPQIQKRLTDLSRQLQVDESFWREQVEAVWPQFVLSEHDGLQLDLNLLEQKHPALQARLLREGLRRLRGDLHGIEAVHLAALRGLIAGKQPQAELDLPRCWAARRYGRLWLRTEASKVVGYAMTLQLGKRLRLPDGRALFAELVESAGGENSRRVEFSASQLRFPLQVRTPQPGDKFVPSGMAGRRKIKDFLIDLKVVKEQRRTLPLLLNQDEILWVVGFRRSALEPVTEKSAKILAVRLLEPEETATNIL